MAENLFIGFAQVAQSRAAIRVFYKPVLGAVAMAGRPHFTHLAPPAARVIFSKYP